MPTEYFDAMMNVTAIPDYTCTYESSTVYNETPEGGEFLCYCDGYDFKGMPSLSIVMYDNNIQYDMATSQYMLDPYLNETTGTTHCILGLAGPSVYMARTKPDSL